MASSTCSTRRLSPRSPFSLREPLQSNRVNVEGTLCVLLAARDAGVKRLIYAGSSSAYGDHPELPKREDHPTNPLSPYALAKLAGEHYCRLFTELYHLETVTLRYFNVFGARQNPNSQYAAVIPKFITACLKHEPLPSMVMASSHATSPMLTMSCTAIYWP